jgi:hypothetical protein
VPTDAPSPTVIPMIAHEDASAALAWLTKAFGFRERTRSTMPDGSIGHAEMEIGGDGVIMLAEPSPHYQGPTRHADRPANRGVAGETPPRARRVRPAAAGARCPGGGRGWPAPAGPS